jgi:hypothetical protein
MYYHNVHCSLSIHQSSVLRVIVVSIWLSKSEVYHGCFTESPNAKLGNAATLFSANNIFDL